MLRRREPFVTLTVLELKHENGELRRLVRRLAEDRDRLQAELAEARDELRARRATGRPR